MAQDSSNRINKKKHDRIVKGQVALAITVLQAKYDQLEKNYNQLLGMLATSKDNKPDKCRCRPMSYGATDMSKCTIHSVHDTDSEEEEK